MRVDFVFYKLLVWFLLTIILSHEDDRGCRQTMEGGVLWPETKSSACVKSSPLCIGENMEILTRCCHPVFDWNDAPHCYYFQDSVKSPCPDNFITNLMKNSCIFVVKDSIYPPKCPYEETLPFAEYIHDIDFSWLPVWMPVVRNKGKYGLDLLRWIEPALDYKLAYTGCIENNCHNFHFSGSLKDKSCLIFYNTSYVEAVSCDEKHTAVCAYRSLPNRSKSFCSQSFPLPNVCMQSDYSTKSKCFCKGSTDSMTSDAKAEFLQPYQNLLYPSLSKEVCRIGLKRNPLDNYIWANSNAELNYTYWAENTVFGEQYKYGVTSLDGWTLLPTDTGNRCILYEVDLPKQESEIILKYDERKNIFSVNMTNPANWVSHENAAAPMVFCFTDAASDTLVSRMEVDVLSVTPGYAVYSFEPHGDGPGTYWCEAFLYPDVTPKSSNEYLLRYSDHSIEEYAVVLKTNYVKGSNPLTHTNLKLIRNLLAHQIKSFPTISNFITRIYQIIDINEVDAEITVNFHLANPTNSEPLKLYSALRGFLEQNITEFTFVNVFGVDSCVGIQTIDSTLPATWPITNINEEADRPREGFCLRSDGSIMTRRCYGDYINGAKWSELEEPCNIQESTNITVNLTNIIGLNNPQEYIRQIAEIVANHEDLVPLDIHLISKFLEQLASSNHIDIYTFIKIVDRLLNVPEAVLRDSQIDFNATDRILYYTDQIIINSNYIGELMEQNFFIISYHIKDSNLSGIILKSYSEIYFNIHKIFNLFDLDEIKRIDDLNAAVVWSRSLMNHVYVTQDYRSRVIVLVYKNSKLFSEEQGASKSAGMIMGVLVPDLRDNTFLGEIFTIYNNTGIANDFNCSFWSYDLDVKKGSWVNDAQRNDRQSVVLCVYDHLTHLGLVQKEKFSITDQLQLILSSAVSISEKLEKASVILSNHYMDFKPIDVKLISLLLQEATLTTDDNLDLVADIVDKVIDIPPDILEESQTMYNATGKILNYFDDILQQCSSSRIIQRTNFYAIVQFLREKDFYGFVLNDCVSKCTLTLLRTVPSEMEILLVHDLDTAMLISQELMDQLLEASGSKYSPKIVTVIFSNDNLFIDDYAVNPKMTSKVVGVFISNFDESFNGNIKLLYNVNLNVTANYTCSIYNNDSNETTYEKGFWNAENPPIPINNFLECQFWKPKYFALVYNIFNVTKILENMLNFQESVDIILRQTDAIASNYHSHLQAVDIFIIAKLLSKVTEVNNLVIETCLDIVSNIMKVPRDILKESQEMYNATNLVLYNFNIIAQNCNKTKAMYKDNVILVVSLLSESGVLGISLDNCNKQCEVTLLYEQLTDGESTDMVNFDTELKINHNLMDQLLYDRDDDFVPKLILTVYYNDALFNSENDIKGTSKIFGVFLPNFNQILSHEIKLYFNMPNKDESEGYDCALWDLQRGNWAYESQARGIERLSCNFYQQSYFTLTTGNTHYDNVTNALAELSTATVFFPEKLYKAEDISYYYSEFKSADIHILSQILSQCDQLSDNGLDRLSAVINNILRIPPSILRESQDQYNALHNILNDIIHIASVPLSWEYSSIDQFAVVACQVNSTEKNSIVVTSENIQCTNFDENNLPNIENTLAVTILSNDLLHQVIAITGYQKVVVTVFFNDIFFTGNETSTKSVILGVSVPHLKEEFQGDMTILFNSSTYKSNFVCAYWDDDGTNQWNNLDATAKPQPESFTRCNTQKTAFFALVENANKNEMTNITERLLQIIAGDLTPSEKLSQTLDALTLYIKLFKAIDVYYVAQILSLVDKIHLEDLKFIANITDLLMKIPRNILTESQRKYDSTDWILYHVDRIAQRFNGFAKIVKENFAVVITNNIAGISIDTSCAVEILHGNVDLTDLTDNDNFDTALILDSKLRGQLDRDSAFKIFITIYFSDALFNENRDTVYKNIGQIIGVTMPSIQSMNGPLKFYYHAGSTGSTFCAFWNYSIDENGMEKGYWEGDNIALGPARISVCESTHMTHFALLANDKNVTNDLENILKSNSTAKEKLKQVLVITLDVPKELVPVDIFLISEILNCAIGKVDSDEMNLTAHIISRLFHVKRDVLRESQIRYHATDKILHSIDEMAKLMDESDGHPIVYESFIIAVYDLMETNVSGLVLEYCDTTMCEISVLKNSVNLTEVSNNENLETMIALSDELLDQIRQSTSTVKLVLTIFFSDALFNEQSESNKKTTMVCGVLLPGFEGRFAGNIYFMFNTAGNGNNSCAYWNYKVENDESIVKGSWKTDTDPRKKDRFAFCEFDHVTHFALLLAKDDSTFMDANTFYILDIMTAVNCLLSLVGIFGILLTAFLFERWRKNTGNQILLNFAIAISIKIVMLYVSVEVYNSHAEGVMCSISGAILHFAMLAEFCWMLIIAILQFKRFVEVLGGPPKYVLLKACVCGWIFPALPVMLILIIDSDNYNEGQVGLCYPSGLGLYLGIWLPLIIIITINFVIFFFIIYNVFHKKTETRDLVNHEILFQWRLALLLFSMLGLTWLFGFVSQIQGAYIFVYLFCFTATLQGFIMFLFFIVFNQSTRFLYSQSIKLWLYSRGYKVR